MIALPLLGLARIGRAAEPKSSGPAAGTLVIMGGGAVSAPVAQAATNYAGGSAAHWVVIPTAESDSELAKPNVPRFITAFGPPTILHTRDRAVADSEAFVAPLHTATAVWIQGGRQWRLADAYLGTRTEQALRDLLQRGGLICGSSAGASIQASFLVRGAPSGNSVLMSPGHEQGFGFLRNVAIDQHIGVRDREADLSRVVAKHPGLLGIGIDQSTAIVVRGNIFTVVGPGIVAITDGAMHGGRPYYLLRHGARFDLASWSVLPPAS